MGRSVRTSLPIVVLAALFAPGAPAAPRETVTYTGVDSTGELNSPQNQVRTTPFAGGYTAYRLRVSGTLQSVDALTFRTDARIMVQPPGAAAMVIQPFASGGTFTTATVTDAAFDLPGGVVAGGTWSFRFYETVWDSGLGPDATWTTISFTLDDQAPGAPVTLTPVGGTYTEVEDNDTKARANIIDALTPGERITGTTTGSALGGGGSASADYFLLRTVAAPPAIYRHRLAIASPTPGHVGAIRGRSQADGVIGGTSDLDVQTSSTTSVPARSNLWYGFGKRERVYWRITGSASTTSPYTATYARDVVAPMELGVAIVPGSIVISTIGQGYVSDTDLWLYDQDFNAIPDAGNDDAPGFSGLSRLAITLAPGAYHLALAPYNLANNLPSPIDPAVEGWRNGPVLDFPDAVAQSTSLLDANVGFSITDAAGTHAFPARRAGSFEVVWARLVVGGGCPADLDDGSRTGTRDGAVSIDDLVYFLALFEQGDVRADLDDDGADPGTPDGAVTIQDLIYFLIHFEAGC